MQHDQPVHIKALDGVRGLACLMVVLVHWDAVYQLSGNNTGYGSVGVVIFFCLSGFLMGHLYLTSAPTYDEVSKYVLARFSRITPAYYIAVIVAFLLFLAIPDFEYKMTPVNLARAFLYAGSEGVFWSIPVEVQFYACFILLWLFSAWARKGQYIPLLALCAVMLAMIVTRDKWGGILLPSKLHIFLTGVAAALVYRRVVDAAAPVVFLAAQLLLTFLCIGYYLLFIGNRSVFSDLLFPVLISLTLIALSKETAFSAIFSNKAMRLLGAVSFSVYLFHHLILEVLMKMGPFAGRSDPLSMWLVLAIITGVPIIFHYLCERPLTLMTRRASVQAVQQAELRLKAS